MRGGYVVERKTKRIALTLIGVICLLVLTAGMAAAEPVSFIGTVTYVTVEGGFWGIVADDGKNYDPRNLPTDFKQEGLKVQVEAITKDMMSIHMWGTIIDITNIRKTDNPK
jgi:hypothetical protein